jgi:hypothetical protein
MLSNEMIKGLVELRKYLGENEINVNDCQFKVLTQDEIDAEFYDFQVTLLDDLGLNSFSDFALSHILDNFVEYEYFKYLHYDIIAERQEYYDDSEIEELCRIYDEENVEKMLEIDFQEQFNSVDSVEFCRDFMGDEEFCRIVEENGLINMDELVEYIKEVDGYDILSNYDGNVYEMSDHDEYYYIYRVY